MAAELLLNYMRDLKISSMLQMSYEYLSNNLLEQITIMWNDVETILLGIWYSWQWIFENILFTKDLLKHSTLVPSFSMDKRRTHLSNIISLLRNPNCSDGFSMDLLAKKKGSIHVYTWQTRRL